MRKVVIFHNNEIAGLETEVNAWFEAHPEVAVWRVLQSQSSEGKVDKGGYFCTWLTVTLFYSVPRKMDLVNAKG